MTYEVPENLSVEDAKKLLDEKVQTAYAAIAEAQAVSDQYRLSFSFDITWGMGGTYIGDPDERAEYYGYGNYYEGEDDGWRPSSRSC